MANSSDVRILRMDYYLFLQDLSEAIILSQLVYWRDSEFCKWKITHNKNTCIKIDQENLIKSFPWLARTTLWRKLESLKSKDVLHIFSSQGVNIYQPNEGQIMNKKELFTDILRFKMKHTTFQNETSYISIIYIIYILDVASRTITDQNNIGFKQVRNFYYKLANRTRSSPAKELSSYQKLNQDQVDSILDAIANTAMKKYFNFSCDFQENFQLFSTWLNQYAKSNAEEVDEETSELMELFKDKHLDDSVFHYWATKVNLPKEIYDAHAENSSRAIASSKYTRKQSLHSELEAIANYQPRHLLSEKSDS